MARNPRNAKMRAINFEALRNAASVKHLRMSKSQFHDILKLLRLGHGWHDICELAGGAGVIHSVAWYVGKHPQAHSELEQAMIDGKKFNEIKELAAMQGGGEDDSAVKIQRDRLKLELKKLQAGSYVSTGSPSGAGIGAALERAHRLTSQAQSADVIDLEPLNISRAPTRTGD